MKFVEFNLSEEILRGIKDMGFEEASPIQDKCIEPLLKGRDVIGQAQTGTGKTAAFGIPMLEMVDMNANVQGLVLVPTRELAIQVSEELIKLGKYKKGLTILPIYGGADMRRQLKALKKGVQIVVGTPGRVMDHLRRKSLNIEGLKIAVLDEADEMFAMGFRDDMKVIMDQTNENKTTCFFSATMGKEITNFSRLYQTEPEIIKIKHKELTVENIKQYYLEMTSQMKTEILSRIIDIHKPELAIIFCNTKRKVDELVGDLTARGYSADGLHGDLKQSQRDVVMKKFRQSTIDILVATDVAARGIDVGNVDIVVNYDLPQDEEYYVHRIGRTARAGRTGKSFTFVSGRDAHKLQSIIKYTKAKMEYMELPTIKDMRAEGENKLVELIIQELNKGEDLSRYKAIVDNLLQKEYGPVEIAAVIMKQFDESNSIRNHEELDRVDYGRKFSLNRNSERNQKNKRNSKDKTYRTSKKSQGTNNRHSKKVQRIFINKGKRDGIEVGNILAAIRKESNISSKVVGNISIKNNFSFIEVPREHAGKVISSLDGKKIKNSRVSVELASN